MPAGNGEARQFTAGQRPAIAGESAGEGGPIVLCHGLTATRRSVVHGSRRLERAGHTVITYDARGHGESDPAPTGEGYDYSELVADLEAVVVGEVGEGPLVLGGHSMGAHTAVAYALRHPNRIAGLIVIGPTYEGTRAPLGANSAPNGATIAPESLRYWDGLAEALKEDGIDGFVSYIERFQETDPRWRDSVLRFTRERMERHRHLDALVAALHEVPRSRPFEAMSELEHLDVPALVVASHDAADPGHPYAVAREYAGRLPQARLVSEAEGQSPLAWQGGRLSREIAEFCAEPAVNARLST